MGTSSICIERRAMFLYHETLLREILCLYSVMTSGWFPCNRRKSTKDEKFPCAPKMPGERGICPLIAANTRVLRRLHVSIMIHNVS
jgi:hypothetical protein